MIQFVTFLSPNVGGHLTPQRRVTYYITIPKRSRLESPGIYIYIYTSTLQGVPNGWERVPLSNPLGFKYHPLEGPGRYVTHIPLNPDDPQVTQLSSLDSQPGPEKRVSEGYWWIGLPGDGCRFRVQTKGSNNKNSTKPTRMPFFRDFGSLHFFFPFLGCPKL